MTVYDVGDVVTITFEARDGSTGELVEVGTGDITVTDPYGTTTTATLGHDDTGIYYADYTTTVAGRHIATFTATGANAGVQTETFDVRDSTGAIVSLGEVKDYLNITGTDYDDELASFIDTVSRGVEDYTGRVFRRQSFTEFLSGGEDHITVKHVPLLTVSALYESGVDILETEGESAVFGDNDTGILYRTTGSYPNQAKSTWTEGLGNVYISYTAGYVDVPATVRHAALVWLRHLWTTQRGTMPLARPSAEEDFLPGSTYTMPNRVRELLDPYVVLGVG